MLKPGQHAPALKLPLVGGGEWSLEDQDPKAFTMLLFYRGSHCPICKKQLEEVNRKLDAFADHGIELVAISMDDEVRAKKSADEWDVDGVSIAYGLTQADGARFGLYFSNAIKDGEPAVFSEPATVLIRPKGTVYAIWKQSTPFARPALDDVLSAVEFIQEKDYPARGTAT